MYKQQGISINIKSNINIKILFFLQNLIFIYNIIFAHIIYTQKLKKNYLRGKYIYNLHLDLDFF